MITAEQIAKAKILTRYRHSSVLHEHDDCIRIAFEWLDAQIKTKNPSRQKRPIKHLIEQWGGRYVSQSDVEVAAAMHPGITGTYPHFNISSRLVKPSDSRLEGIAEARTHSYKMSADTYAHVEE
jgi:hypothetical protein